MRDVAFFWVLILLLLAVQILAIDKVRAKYGYPIFSRISRYDKLFRLVYNDELEANHDYMVTLSYQGSDVVEFKLKFLHEGDLVKFKSEFSKLDQRHQMDVAPEFTFRTDQDKNVVDDKGQKIASRLSKDGRFVVIQLTPETIAPIYDEDIAKSPVKVSILLSDYQLVKIATPRVSIWLSLLTIAIFFTIWYLLITKLWPQYKDILFCLIDPEDIDEEPKKSKDD